MKKKNKFLFVVIAIIVFGVIYAIISLTQNVGKTTSTVNMESSIKKLDLLYKDINVRTSSIARSNAITSDEQVSVLPDISEYPFVVNPTTDNFITIYSSTEKANEAENAWICEVAENFNKNNSNISVGVRAIPSNLATDFILSEKYTPDIFMPSSDIYGKMLDSKEKKYDIVKQSIVNNVSGIVISKKVKDEKISVKTVRLFFQYSEIIFKLICMQLTFPLFKIQFYHFKN